MNTVGIYFNHWFSSIYGVIEDVKSRMGDQVKIVMSSKNKNHTCKNIVDVFLDEPDEADNDKYIEQCLRICLQYGIKIFFPRNKSSLISMNKYRFEQIGVNVAVDEIDNINAVNNKICAYEKLKNSYLDKLIPYYFSGGISEKKMILSRLERDNNICMKLASDEGGKSFRVIEKGKGVTFSSLTDYRVNRISYTEAKSIVETAGEELGKIMFMEVLDGPEISIDCYSSKKGFIAICRNKEHSRIERIYVNEVLSNICCMLSAIFQLSKPFNVQLRPIKGGSIENVEDLRLLEINTRLSGGTYLESAVGLNIAYVYIEDVIGSERYNYREYLCFEDKHVTHVEKAEVLQDE